MLVVAAEEMALCSVPASSPEQTVVLELAKLGALVGWEGVGFQDALLLHGAGAQADALAGVLLTQAPGRVGCRVKSVKVTAIL